MLSFNSLSFPKSYGRRPSGGAIDGFLHCPIRYVELGPARLIPKDLGSGNCITSLRLFRAPASLCTILRCISFFFLHPSPCLYARAQSELYRALACRHRERFFRSYTRHPRSSNGTPPRDQLLDATSPRHRARTMEMIFHSTAMTFHSKARIFHSKAKICRLQLIKNPDERQQ